MHDLVGDGQMRTYGGGQSKLVHVKLLCFFRSGFASYPKELDMSRLR